MGSTKTLVRQTLGEPDDEDVGGDWDYYGFPDRVILSFQYADARVVANSMFDRVAVVL